MYGAEKQAKEGGINGNMLIYFMFIERIAVIRFRSGGFRIFFKKAPMAL